MTINWIGLWTIIRREMSRLMRVPIQAFVAPWISALLFIFIFGFVVGRRISTIGGHRYLEFVLPGILMMNIVNAAFLQSSSQIYFSRFLRYVEEMLVSPLSYAEMIAGVLAIGHRALRRHGDRHSCCIAALFGADLGAEVSASSCSGWSGFRRCSACWASSSGLWAKNFEQLTILNVFFITPLSFVGGVFNTVAMLPPLAALAGLWPIRSSISSMACAIR